MAQLELINLSKRFGDVEAVRQVSLGVDEGKLLVLVGPSGCGKTTLLRLIAGFETPDAGQVFISGQSVLTKEPQQRSVGLVFQDYALFPHMSVQANVAYGLKLMRGLGAAQKDARIEELLEMMGLLKLRSRMPEELSAGQQQRVALARTLAPRPKIVLLDEPFSALDQWLRESLRFELKRLQRELKITMIHVTHDQDEALALADRLAVMNEGRIEQIDSPADVYERPRTKFVAGFIGRGNLLMAKVLRTDVEAIWVRLSCDDEIRLPNERGVEVPSGSKVDFMIRPEKIELGAQHENRLRGVLRGVEFLGDAVRLHVDAAGQGIIVKVAASALEPAPWRDGHELVFSFKSESCRLL